MHLIDWSIVLVLNGSIILFALLRSRDTKTSGDWFLANRTLPWWIVGLSLYATAIDASDLVADSGGVYHFGISLFVVNWVGVVVGWLFMSQRIALSMYRLGMYTNAEYLEARFTTSTRIVSAMIQVLYRTVIMGIIGTTAYLVLSIVAEWTMVAAWTAVVAIAGVATVYTVVGGLKSVAVTDALQAFIMLAASAVLFCVVYSSVGGWAGIEAGIREKDVYAANQALHVGSSQIDRQDVAGLSQGQIDALIRLGGVYNRDLKTIDTTSPGWLVSVYFVIAGIAYSIVNHTQAMRLLGSRSEWDLKMSIVLAGVIMLVVTMLNLSMGLMGRVLYDLTGPEVDEVFPRIVRDFTGIGLRGVVMAGIIAAAFSTYDSIGSTISALLTRDVYARLLVRDRDDAHYLMIGRWLTPAIIFGSFIYVPFLLKQGMVLFYLKIVGSFVVPLLTVYLMGAFTRVHRSSATYGLLAGVGYGILFLASEPIARGTQIAILAPPFCNPYAVSPISMLITAGTMVAASVIFGWEVQGYMGTPDETGWLAKSRMQIQQIGSMKPARNDRLPALMGIAVAVTGIILSFVVFW